MERDRGRDPRTAVMTTVEEAEMLRLRLQSLLVIRTVPHGRDPAGEKLREIIHPDSMLDGLGTPVPFEGTQPRELWLRFPGTFDRRGLRFCLIQWMPSSCCVRWR